MKKKVFVSDFFIENGLGGAELTTDAIMRAGRFHNFEIGTIHCVKLTRGILEASKDNVHFIVCNFKSMQDDIKLYMCKNSSYSIVEYDYKICDHRSFELHEANEMSPCDCETRLAGKLTSAFYGYAERVWFMSEKQKNLIMAKVPALKEKNCKVLSSVFSPADLRFIYSIKDNEKNDKYLILNSNSWIKGTQQCVKFAEDNNREYEIVSELPYHEMLIKLSCFKGLIFRPLGSDTCPRLVIEAKMLGCDLILNEHVQHKDEPWFETQESCYEHMDTRTEAFWSYYGQ